MAVTTAPRQAARALPDFKDVERVCRNLRPVDPVYALYPKRFRAAADRFLKGFPGTTLYAVKANPAPDVLDLIYASGIRHFDTASIPEVALISKRYPDAVCHFMAPIRLPGAAGIAYKKYGVRDFVIDDEVELTRVLDETGALKGKRASDLTLFVRLSTPVEGALLELSSKFGTNAANGARLLKLVADAGCKPALTFHVGSQCLRPEAYSEAIAICAEVSAKAGVTLAALDVGGGFPVPYPGHHAKDLSVYFAEVRSGLAALKLPKGTPVYCEPGRALCAEGVSLVTLVVRRRGSSIYINDGTYGSLDEMAIPSWTVDYPKRVISLTEGGTPFERQGPKSPYKIFGPTCDTLDVLPRPVLLPQGTETGDWIEWGMIGAYSCALRTGFNGFYPETFVTIA